MNTEYINNDIKPGDDFFKFATGKWIDLNPKPDDEAQWDSWNVIENKVRQQNREILDEIVKNPGGGDVMSYKIATFYKTMSNYDKRDSEGIRVMLPYINKIMSFNTKDEVIEFCQKELAYNFLLCVECVPDFKNSNHYEVMLSQRLLLNNKSYYTSDDPYKQEVLKKFAKNKVDILTALNFQKNDIDRIIDTVIDFDCQIAEVSYSIEELCMDPMYNYHMMDIEEASKLVEFDLNKYLSWFGMNDVKKVNIAQVDAIKKAFELINTMTLVEMKDNAIFHLIDNYKDTLRVDIEEIAFEFIQFMTGVKERPELWKRELDKVESFFSETFAQKYVEKFFPKESKDKMILLIENLKKSYAEIISNQSWLCPETRNYALKKLSMMKCKVGYPDKWKDYTDMPVNSNVSYFEMTREIMVYSHNRYINDYFDKDVDMEEWPMYAHKVNACYSPMKNEICFPAAVLQEPFFNKDADDSDNYGGIGVIIGHEMTHGFDSYGRLFGIDGNVFDWWTDDESEEFDELSENTRDHFNEIYALPGIKCNGDLTLNENIADFGGLKIAYNALKMIYGEKVRYLSELLAMKDDRGEPMFSEAELYGKNGMMKDGYDWKKRFFLNFANCWAGVSTEEVIKHRIENDEHCPNYIRVNGTLPMFDEWYSAFKISKNDKLYINKEKRAKLW